MKETPALETPMENKHACRCLVAYHANCIDGFTSAWVSVRALENEGHTVSLIPVEYTSKSMADLKGTINRLIPEELYVVDFSLSVGDIADMRGMYPHMKVTILDHHKSAFEMYKPGIEVEENTELECKVMGAHIFLDNSMSGAGICWDYFHTRSNTPWLVKYVEDYDIWRFAYGRDTKAINMFLRGEEKELEVWDKLAVRLGLDKYKKGILEEGYKRLELFDRLVEEYAATAFPITLAGKKGYCVKCPREYASSVGNRVATCYREFCAILELRDTDSPKTSVGWSLRSVGDLDVSKIAKHYRGGGHRNAAGFSLTLEKSLKIIKKARREGV